MRLPALPGVVEVSMWIFIDSVQPSPLFYLLDARGIGATQPFFGNKLQGTGWGNVSVDMMTQQWDAPLIWHALPVAVWAHLQVSLNPRKCLDDATFAASRFR
jgi:hypothetical protein